LRLELIEIFPKDPVKGCFERIDNHDMFATAADRGPDRRCRMTKTTITTNRSSGKPTTVTTHKQYGSGASTKVTRTQGGVGSSGKIISTSKSNGK